MLLMAMTILNNYCDNADNCTDRFMKVDWLRGLITVECMTTMSLFSYYIIKMRQFNRLRMPPDVLRESYMKALRNNLVLRFNDEEPVTRKKERTPEEAHQRNVREDDAFQNHPIIVA